MITIHFDRFIDFRREGLQAAWRSSHRPGIAGADRVGSRTAAPERRHRAA